MLYNWPFCSNDNCVAGGGWPGGLAWSTEANPLARGAVVMLNGGEGLISYGNGVANGLVSGNTLFEQNVSADNWSMNSYVDNQPKHVIRNNLFTRHQPNPKWMWDSTDAYSTEKFRTCLALADEYASGNPQGTSSMANAQVYNNLFLGCRYGISDYNESTTGHGMKNDLIANNTIVIDARHYTDETVAGIALGDNGGSDTGTLIVNNLIVRTVSCSTTGCPLVMTAGVSPLSGIVLKNNLYFAVGKTATSNELFGTNSANNLSLVNFSNWQNTEPDTGAVYSDPLLTDLLGLVPAGAAGPVNYAHAVPMAGSPAHGLGLFESATFSTDFAAAPRGASWTAGALQ